MEIEETIQDLQDDIGDLQDSLNEHTHLIALLLSYIFALEGKPVPIEGMSPEQIRAWIIEHAADRLRNQGVPSFRDLWQR